MSTKGRRNTSSNALVSVGSSMCGYSWRMASFRSKELPEAEIHALIERSEGSFEVFIPFSSHVRVPEQRFTGSSTVD